MRVYDLKKAVTIKKATKENGWNGYYEVPYVEYREDGTVCNMGTEDFSSERLNTLKVYEVVEKTGEKTRETSIYKGGRNKWKHVNYFRVTERKEAVKLAKVLYTGREIQIRKI